MKSLIKQPSSVQAREHNRTKKGVGLVAGAMIAGMLLVGQNVSANEIVTTTDSTTETVFSADTVADSTQTNATVSDTTSTEEVPVEENVITDTTDSTETTDIVEESQPTAMLRSAAVSTATAEGTTVTPTSTVQETSTGTVDIVSNNAFNQNVTANVTTTLSGTVSEGDTVQYLATNIEMRSLNGQDVKMADGTTIGKINVSQVYDSNQIRPTTVETSMDNISMQQLLTVTFNSVVNNLENISYSFGVTNSPTTILTSQASKELSSRIETSNGVVASDTAQGVAILGADLPTVYTTLSNVNVTVVNNEPRPTISGFDIAIPTEAPLQAGDLITLSNQDSNISYDTSKINVGQEYTFTRNRFPYEGTNVNANDIYIYENTTLKVKVVSVESGELVLEVIENIQPEDSAYAISFPTLLTGTEGGSGTTAPYERTITIERAGNVISDKTVTSTINFSGSTVSAIGEQIKRSDVMVRNILTGTDTDLVDPVLLLDNVVKGTEYSSNPADSLTNLYDLVVTPSNAAGTTDGTDIVVVYEWKLKTGSVAWQAKKLSDSTFLIPNVVYVKAQPYGTTYDFTDKVVEKFVAEDGTVWKLVSTDRPLTGSVDRPTWQVTSWYEEVKGSVIENNVSTTGEKLTDTITVVSNVSVGTAYDTSAQEEKITLEDGRVFKLKTKGANSTGKVIEGTTEVVNTYEEVKSSVFEDNFIEGTSTKLTDTATVVSKASVGSAYDSSAQDEVITLADGKSYKLVSKATNSTGKVAETDTYLANYYSEIKGSVVVKFVDTAGNTISEDVVDTKDSSTGVSYDTTDNKPTMILVKNADDTVTAYAFKEISAETSAETGKVVAGETVVTYVYEEVAIVPVKDVLNKDGESVDGGKATVGDVLTFVLDGSPISDGIQGGLWQYDLKDVLDTAKVEYIDSSVKVYAGEFANITLPDGSVLKADDDISSYVTIEYVDGVLTVKPTEEFYTILKDNGVEDLVDIDAQFDVKVIAVGTIENTLIQIVNGFEFKSNTTTTEAEVPVVETPEEPKADEPPVVEESKQSETYLPNTGTEKSYALSVMGVLAMFGSLLGFRKKKETE